MYTGISSSIQTHEEMQSTLRSLRLPGRVNVPTAALLLGFSADDISILVAVGILKPLGKPSKNSSKYFASNEIETAAKSRAFLEKATIAIDRRRREINAKKRSLKNSKMKNP